MTILSFSRAWNRGGCDLVFSQDAHYIKDPARFAWTRTISSHNFGRNQVVRSDWARFFHTSTAIFVALRVQFVNSLETPETHAESPTAWAGVDDRQDTLSYLSLSIFRWSSILVRRVRFTREISRSYRAINSSSTTAAASSDRQGSLISTSHWRSSDSGFVIIRRCRGRSQFSVWRVAVVVCRRWSPSRNPWCRDDRACRRRKSCRWSSATLCPSRSWRAHSRRSESYTPFVVGTLGCDGTLRRPLSPIITLIVICENCGNLEEANVSIKKKYFWEIFIPS